MLRLAFLFFFLILATGCQDVVHPVQLSDYGGTFFQKNVVLRDIPMPRDFHLVESFEEEKGEGTFCFGTPSFRYGEFCLEGEMSAHRLIQFYRSQMAKYWKEVDVQNLPTSARLTFDNPKELCKIWIKETSSATLIKIKVEQKKA